MRFLGHILPDNAYKTPEATAAMSDVAIENLEAYFAGSHVRFGSKAALERQFSGQFRFKSANGSKAVIH